MANVIEGSAALQGELWGSDPGVWAETEENKTAALMSDVLDALGVGRGTALLDAGCGAGLSAAMAVERGAVLTGLDASAPMVDFARERVDGGRFDVGDIEHLPYADGSFDAAMAINSVFYCSDIAGAMLELARVTRDGGRVAITAWGRPERCDMASVFGALLGVLPAKPKGPGPFALSEPGALEGLLAAAGLRPSQQGTTRCLFASPSFDACWRGMLSAGPLQGAARAVGVERVRQAVRAGVEPFVDERGAIAMHNDFVWAIGDKA